MSSIALAMFSIFQTNFLWRLRFAALGLALMRKLRATETRQNLYGNDLKTQEE